MSACSVVDASKKWQRIQEWVTQDSGAALAGGGSYMLRTCPATKQTGPVKEAGCFAGPVRVHCWTSIKQHNCFFRIQDLMCLHPSKQALPLPSTCINTLRLASPFLLLASSFVGSGEAQPPLPPPSVGTAADDAHSVDSTLLELELERTRTSMQVSTGPCTGRESVAASVCAARS